VETQAMPEKPEAPANPLSWFLLPANPRCQVSLQSGAQPGFALQQSQAPGQAAWVHLCSERLQSCQQAELK